MIAFKVECFSALSWFYIKIVLLLPYLIANIISLIIGKKIIEYVEGWSTCSNFDEDLDVFLLLTCVCISRHEMQIVKAPYVHT